MITPPPGNIQIRTLPDLEDAEELDADALEEGSQIEGSPAPLEAEEIVDSDLQSLPESPEDLSGELDADDLESDIAASPEQPPGESRRRLASAAALIGSGGAAGPPPSAAERISAPPASAAALLASSGAAVPGPRAQPEPPPHSQAPDSAVPVSAPHSQAPHSQAPHSQAPHSQVPAPAPSSGPSNSNVILGALVVGLLAVVVILLLNQQKTSGTQVVVSPPAAPTVAQSASPPATQVGCKLSVPPKRLLEKAYLGVAPRATIIAAGKINIGLASSARKAVGLTVALDDLSASQSFSESPPGTVVAVTPTPDGKFLVTHDKQKRDGAVEFSAGMTLGARRSQLELVNNGSPTSLGTLPSGDITTPSVDRAAGAQKSYALVLRSGGQGGKLVFGWLSPSGQLLGTLGAISMSDAFLGTPSVTAGAEHALVSVATRPSADAYWGITLASAALGDPPKVSKAFTPPAGGAGGEAISPAATALTAGHWLLMWTEGPKGGHQVRGQVLDSDLIAASKALNLSGADSDAGQGTLIASEGKVLAVFFTRTPAGAELWGTGLTCQ